MTTVQIPVAEVFRPLLAPKPLKGAYGGRGTGKSYFFADSVVTRSIQAKTDTVCIREVQKDLRNSVKRLIEQRIKFHGLESLFQIYRNEIRGPHGGLIIFEGMNNFTADSIKSLENFNIAWCEEAQTLSEHSLRTLRPTLRRDDSEIWFSWNPRFKTDAVDMLFRYYNRSDAVAVNANWSDNPWFTRKNRLEMEEDYRLIPDEAAHVWGGEYEIVMKGAYYAKQIRKLEQEGRIGSVPYDPQEPVYTAWDLGIDDETAIWFVQIIGLDIHVIDYYKARNVSLLDSAREVLSREYVFAEHYLPHDVETREMTTALSRKDQLHRIGLKPIRPGSRLPVADGINAVRNLLPKCRFDLEKCADGLSALQSYKVDEDQLKATNKAKPQHDWSSHGSDAFRELAVQLFDVKAKKKAQQRPLSVNDYDIFDHNERSFRQMNAGAYDPYDW